MQIHLRRIGNGVEEFFYHLGLHLSYFLPRKFCLEREIRSAAEVNGREHQCLVHRKDSVAVAADALFGADCLADCSSEHDTGVLDRVVAVYIKISVYRNGKVEKTVAGKAVEHMVKKPMPVWMSLFPVPSRFNVMRIFVSFVTRSTLAVLFSTYSSPSKRTAIELACAVKLSDFAKLSISSWISERASLE